MSFLCVFFNVNNIVSIFILLFLSFFYVLALLFHLLRIKSRPTFVFLIVLDKPMPVYEIPGQINTKSSERDRSKMCFYLRTPSLSLLTSTALIRIPLFNLNVFRLLSLNRSLMSSSLGQAVVPDTIELSVMIFVMCSGFFYVIILKFLSAFILLMKIVNEISLPLPMLS